ncbi:MAG: hypothetical protein M5U07_15370 [Xanthobacteraceae bacterium]|nr:hypothetical protein [Xanthobacteraceae bacterium]
MERDEIKYQLTETEARIRQGEQHIAHVRTLLAKLRRDGHDRAAQKAQALLNNLLELQAGHEKECANRQREPEQR